jgi:excisionase family DNA binding protein
MITVQEASPMITVREASLIFRCCTRTILNRIRAGKLKAVKPGQCWLIPKSEIKRVTEPQASEVRGE